MNQLLKNKVFISTRPKGKSGELKRLFELEGGEMLELPLIEIQPTNLSDQEKAPLKKLDSFQWLVLTSSNGVKFFFKQLKETTGDTTLPDRLKIAVIGSKTEKALNDFGQTASFVNPGNTGEDFGETFQKKLKSGSERPNVLLALGNLARNVIQKKIEEQANCSRIDVYKTVAPKQPDKNILQRIQEGRYEMIIFTSPSGIENFMEHTIDINPEKLRIACIGEITSQASLKAGIKPLVVAKNPSAEGIVHSIIKFYN